MGRQPVGQVRGVRRGPLHPQVQGAQPAQGQPGLDGPGDRALGAADLDQPVDDLDLAGHGDAEQQVGVPGEVLRRAVHHDVARRPPTGAAGPGWRRCCRRRAARRRPSRAAASASMSTSLQHRVGGGLGPDQVGALHRGRGAAGVGEVDLAHREPALLLHPAQHREAAVVGVRCRHDDAAERHQVERGGDRGHPGGERRRDPALQRADRALEHLPGRVAVAAVADLAARVVGRGHHERRVLGPSGDRGGRPAETATVAGAKAGSGVGGMAASIPVRTAVGRVVRDERRRSSTPDPARRTPRRRRLRRPQHRARGLLRLRRQRAGGDRPRPLRRRAGRHLPRGPLGAGRRRAGEAGHHRRRAARGRRPTARRSCSSGDPTHRGLAVHEPGQVPRGARRGRRGPAAAARPVRRGRHPPGPARAGRRPLRRLRGLRLGRRDGQGPHEDAAAAAPGSRSGRTPSSPRAPGPPTRPRSARPSPRSATRSSSSRPGPDRASASPRCTAPDELDDAIELARAHDPRVVVEAMLDGREIECGVLEGLDGGAPEASVPGEVVVGGDHEFYDFAAKYLPDEGTDLVVPADLPDAVVAEVQALACAGVRRAGLRGSGPGRLLRHRRRPGRRQRGQHDARASRRCRCSR